MAVKISLSEMSLLLNISKHTLRYYDKVGLIEPLYDTNGYRYYTFEHIYILSTIKTLRDMDVPIKEIKNSIYNQGLEDLTHIIKQSKTYIDQEIERLTKMSRILDDKLRAVKSHSHLHNKWVIREEDEHTYCYVGGIMKENKSRINLEKEIFRQRPNIIHEEDMMFRYAIDNLAGVVYGTADLYVLSNTVNRVISKTVTLPKGKYATFYYRGDEEHLTSGIGQALEEIRSSGYNIGGYIYEFMRTSHIISSTMKTFFAEFRVYIEEA